MTSSELRIWTVGHSTRSIDEFESLLKVNAIESLVDVRSFPSSRRHPQFNREELAEQLNKTGITYLHLPALGGRRPPALHSKNTAWQNASFRGYADYMESHEFRAGLESLLQVGSKERTVIMCAEALWWRCHRGLIADALKSRGHLVLHIVSATKVEEHPYTSAARIENGELTYRGLLEEF